jgi:serine/threonine protein kinase
MLQNSDSFIIKKILAAPRQSILYLAEPCMTADDSNCFDVPNLPSCFVIKTPRQATASIREAYEDEYESLKSLSHPVLPHYYALCTNFRLPVQTEASDFCPALVMEYIDGIPLSSMPHLTTKQLQKYILDLGDCLLYLLDHGVLYTDLHPGNLLIQNESLKLIDFTRAYYYQRNPYPTYTPKISYHLDPNLKAQQLLTQSVTHLLQNLPPAFTQNLPQEILSQGNGNPIPPFSEYLQILTHLFQ